MPPRRRSSSGYRGVRARPNGTFYAEIRSGDERIGLGTFETAWRLGRSRRSMNFDDVTTRQQAEMLAPPPPAVTREQRQRELEQSSSRSVMSASASSGVSSFRRTSPRWRPSTPRRPRRRRR
jgi:hypothetical protein